MFVSCIKDKGREVTLEKMGITTGETATALDKIQDIAYAHSEGDYEQKYETLCESVPGIVEDIQMSGCLQYRGV